MTMGIILYGERESWQLLSEKSVQSYFLKSANNLLWCRKAPIRVVVMNQEKHILSKSLRKHMGKTYKVQRGNIGLLYILCQSEGFLKPFPLDTLNNKKEQLNFALR